MSLICWSHILFGFLLTRSSNDPQYKKVIEKKLTTLLVTLKVSQFINHVLIQKLVKTKTEKTLQLKLQLKFNFYLKVTNILSFKCHEFYD